jgi:hypothetical protein
MQTCIARLRQRQMAAAYAAWTDAAAHWASRREAAAAALRHWEHSAAASAFATWHDVAAEHYNTDAAASHHCIRVLKAAFHAIGREYMPKTVPACVPLLGSVAIARAQQHCKGSRTIDG